jgi:hypothetical protein
MQIVNNPNPPFVARPKTQPRIAIPDIDDFDVGDEVSEPIHDFFELSGVIGDERLRHEYQFND